MRAICGAPPRPSDGDSRTGDFCARQNVSCCCTMCVFPFIRKRSQKLGPLFAAPPPPVARRRRRWRRLISIRSTPFEARRFESWLARFENQIPAPNLVVALFAPAQSAQSAGEGLWFEWGASEEPVKQLNSQSVSQLKGCALVRSFV